MALRLDRTAIIAGLAAALCLIALRASATDDVGKRIISYEDKHDLFYNDYVGGPCSTPAAMYVSPRPVPPNVGWTYTTYQPLMPHEYLYRHTMSHYAYEPGAGWSRAKVRYRTYGLRLDDLLWSLSGPKY